MPVSATVKRELSEVSPEAGGDWIEARPAIRQASATGEVLDFCALTEDVKSVWLMVGSTGAGEALQAFLNRFRTPPPIAFLYAQHYDPELQDHLGELTLENSSFELCLADRSACLKPGRVVIVPPRNRVSIADTGCVSPAGLGWRNRYSPHIDELLLTFSRAGLPAPGVIFFSGMGDDGSRALLQIADSGTDLWAQDPLTAVCGAMPQAAIDTGLVSYVSCPAGLASALLNRY